MSLVGSGRKKTQVWQHFNYNDNTKKTRCKVRSGDDEADACAYTLSGKNTTNLKRHLKLRHPDIYATVSGELTILVCVAILCDLS